MLTMQYIVDIYVVLYHSMYLCIIVMSTVQVSEPANVPLRGRSGGKLLNHVYRGM